MNNLIATGYIIADDHGIIHGVGETADLAWADMEHVFAQANIRLLEDDEDRPEEDGNWSRWSRYAAVPATAALIQAVLDMGGDVDSRKIDGIACTPEEYALIPEEGETAEEIMAADAEGPARGDEP